MKTNGNIILVTGGGSGIGQALALRWARAGNEVIVTGRRRSALEETVAGADNIHAFEMDLADPESISAVSMQILDAHPRLNILVNNAGIMRSESIANSRDLTDAEETIVTNLLGPIRLIDALVDHLAGTPESAIVTVTSGLAFVPYPSAATYSATKAAIHSYTQALRMQLAGKVEVIEIAPPAVQTDLTPGQRTRPGYQPLDDFADETFALLNQQPTPSEILVANVHPLRFAERDGTVQERLEMLAAR